MHTYTFIQIGPRTQSIYTCNAFIHRLIYIWVHTHTCSVIHIWLHAQPRHTLTHSHTGTNTYKFIYTYMATCSVDLFWVMRSNSYVYMLYTYKCKFIHRCIYRHYACLTRSRSIRAMRLYIGYVYIEVQIHTYMYLGNIHAPHNAFIHRLWSTNTYIHVYMQHTCPTRCRSIRAMRFLHRLCIHISTNTYIHVFRQHTCLTRCRSIWAMRLYMGYVYW